MKSDLTQAGLLGAIVLIVSFFSLGVIEPWAIAVQWLVQASALWCWAYWETWRRSELNRSHFDAPLFPALGWANRLTLLRGGLIALTGGFLFQPQAAGLLAWVPGLLYGMAAILDRVDGLVARKTRRTSLLGTELDTVFDALGMLVAPMLAVGYGKLHWSYLLVSFAYYLFQWGIAWRHKYSLPIYPILPSVLRRALAGFQMGFIAILLLPIFPALLTRFSGWVFMLPVLAGFILDWLVVTGHISGSSPKTLQFFGWLNLISRSVVQPLLRLLLVICIIFIWRDFDWINSVQDYLLVLGISLVLLGIIGRLGALIVLLLLCGFDFQDRINFAGYTAIFSAIWLLLLGTGRFSLWQWDDIWVNRQDGA